jgi:hypothetical protein
LSFLCVCYFFLCFFVFVLFLFSSCHSIFFSFLYQQTKEGNT